MIIENDVPTVDTCRLLLPPAPAACSCLLLLRLPPALPLALQCPDELLRVPATLFGGESTCRHKT